MDRRQILHALREKLEPTIWGVAVELERMLGQLARVDHLDPNDPAAIGAVVHSALPSAVGDVKGSLLSCVHAEPGPSNKLTGIVEIEGVERQVSLEWHYAGPHGGTRKPKHQYADVEKEGMFEFPGFETSAPVDLFLFVPYVLARSRTTIDKLYIAFADGFDKLKIELHRPAVAAGAAGSGSGVAGVVPKGTVVKAKKPRKGEEGDAGSIIKRGDGSSSA